MKFWFPTLRLVGTPTAAAAVAGVPTGHFWNFKQLLYIVKLGIKISKNMIYRAIGIMSGSSLDGLDIAFTELTDTGGKWSYEINAAQCLTFPMNGEKSCRLQLIFLH